MKKNLVTILILSLFSLKSYAILQDTVYIRKPESLGLIYRELKVVTKDGFKIAAWFFPAQKQFSDSKIKSLNGAKRPYKVIDSKKRPTFIICNGDAGNMSYFQLVLATAWTNMGFNVVSFDWRGFGARMKAQDINQLFAKTL